MFIIGMKGVPQRTKSGLRVDDSFPLELPVVLILILRFDAGGGDSPFTHCGPGVEGRGAPGNIWLSIETSLWVTDPFTLCNREFTGKENLGFVTTSLCSQEYLRREDGGKRARVSQNVPHTTAMCSATWYRGPEVHPSFSEPSFPKYLCGRLLHHLLTIFVCRTIRMATKELVFFFQAGLLCL